MGVTNLAMIISQWLARTNYVMEIGIHQFIYNVNIIEVLPQRRAYYILDGNNL